MSRGELIVFINALSLLLASIKDTERVCDEVAELVRRNIPAVSENTLTIVRVKSLLSASITSIQYQLNEAESLLACHSSHKSDFKKG